MSAGIRNRYNYKMIGNLNELKHAMHLFIVVVEADKD